MFTSSKPWLTGVNFPPRTKNWQCTAITTMQIKQKQAQFTPDQNCTNTICYPNDEEILHTTKILTTAWINWERMPHHNWTSTKFQKQTRSEFSVTIKNTDSLHKPKILTTAWMNRERLVHHGVKKCAIQMSKTNRTRTKTASTNKERHRRTHNFNYLNEPGEIFSLLTVEESEHKKSCYEINILLQSRNMPIRMVVSASVDF